ncbi:MipA/OmpV family protein [Burkholderia perseverans]|uniref:MipA/OmpV family protein n=1 Tax=Burkholderia perseverans TaxID=2615214 RepID=UPI001FEE83B1|nr:MipA/OmpV family protein [Burkholderia perseverans]
MTALSLRSISLQFGAICFALATQSASAQSAPADEDDGNAGLTILNNATNVTHWGLGAGVGIESSPYRGDGSKVSPIPLLYFDDKWVHVLGTTLDLKAGEWHHVSVALRARFGLFDGYKESDAPALNGMQNRNGALWYGPALAWKTAFGTLSGDFLLGGNKGEQAKLEFGRSFEAGRFSIEPHIGAQWYSSKYDNYYYGVMPSEARIGRPAYTSGASWAFTVGSRVNYRLTEHQRILFDVGVAHLGSNVTNSPIVGRRYVPEASVGYLYQFK